MMANSFPRRPAYKFFYRSVFSFLALSVIGAGAVDIFSLPSLAQTSAATKAKPTKAANAKQAQPAAQQWQDSSEDIKRIARARALTKDGRFDDACSELKAVIKSNPNSVDANYFLGYVLGRQGRYESSIASEKRALELDPNNAQAYAVLGLSLGSLHQYSEAAKALKSAVRLQPMTPSIYISLAAIYEKQGDYKTACNLYRRASTIDPTNAKAYLGLGEALGKLGDKMGNVEACRSAVKYAPKSAIAHAKLGMALSEAGDFGGSVAEGFTANLLKVQESWSDFLGPFLAAWGLVFLGFSLIFAVVFAGSRFKPQDGEKVLRSFFLTFYKDQPGRFVVTDSRLVYVPEIFSSLFGATRVSIQRGQIESIQYRSTMGGGTVSILTRDQSVHQFRMPILVLDPLRSLLVSQALAGGPEEDGAPAQTEEHTNVQTISPAAMAELEITEADTAVPALPRDIEDKLESKTEPESKVESEPESKPESNPESKPESKADSKAESKAESKEESKEAPETSSKSKEES